MRKTTDERQNQDNDSPALDYRPPDRAMREGIAGPAFVAFLVGMLAIPADVVPGLGVLIGLVAVIISWRALRRIAAHTYLIGWPFAVAGLVLGVVAVAAGLVWTWYVVARWRR